jgi:hypothetical protein
MTDRLLIVTEPDDTPIQGIRIVHVDLTQEQRSIVSAALVQSSLMHSVINYVWNVNESIEWLIDKIAKSDLVIFNADSANELIVGWSAAHRKSYYFGTLKDLSIANNRAIYSVEDISILLEKVARQYEQV